MSASWDDVFIDSSSAHVALIEVVGPNRISVMILGDETWGDMGYDVWIENGVIVKEGFGERRVGRLNGTMLAIASDSLPVPLSDFRQLTQ